MKKMLILSISGLFLTAALFLFTRLGTEFLPIMDEGAFDMDITLLPGVSLSKAMEGNQLAGQKMKEFDELDVVVSRTGQTGVALDTRGADKTGYVGRLRPKSEWKRDISREELTNEMRESLETIPGIGFGFSQPIQCRIDELVAGTRAQLILKLFGEDIDVLKRTSEEIARVLLTIRGGTDLMTASIAIFSLIPLLFASGTGSEIQKPLATVVVGGLITSTLLTLLIIPSIYSWFEKKNVES